MGKFRCTVSQVELIAKTYEAYEKQIGEYEAKRTGNPDKDALIDQIEEMPKAKCKILEQMYEIETGKKMFAD